MPKYTLDQLKKLENYEKELAYFRKEYSTAVPSRQKTILLMVRALKLAWRKVTGEEYQRPMLDSPEG